MVRAMVRTIRRSVRRLLPVAGIVLAANVVACDEPKEEAGATSATATAPAPPPAPKKPEGVPSMLVDDRGPVVGTDRVKEDMSKPAGLAELKKLLTDLPYTDEPVVVRVLKNANMGHVVEMVFALGEAGAPKVLIKTDPPRTDVPGELLLTPEQKLDEVDGCSVAAMVNEKLDTGVWEFKGGLGTRHPKGMAGPDLSNTQETIKKKLDRCDSDVAFLSTAHGLPWEHAFALGAQFAKADEKKKLKHLVLLGIEPVGGKKIELRK